MKTAALFAILCVYPLGGCNRRSSCETAITNAIAVGRAGSAIAADETKRTNIKTSMIAHCKADAWADTVVACYGEAKDNDSLGGCIDKLTKDQQDKLMADLAPIMSGGSR